MIASSLLVQGSVQFFYFIFRHCNLNRHIKKYYFYFLGLYYSYLNRYDDAIEAYSKVMRYRFFFADVQSKFEQVYKKRMLKSSLLITGGVGDFLQCIEYIVKNPSNDYVVITHFPKAKEFFEAFGIKINQVHVFSNVIEEKLISSNVFNSGLIYKCPRNLFFENNPLNITIKASNENNYPTVGLHMSGSDFAAKLRVGLTPKALPHTFIHHLLNYLQNLNLNVIFFATQKEISELGIKENLKLQIACDKDITKNLSLVARCNAFIGSDSAFKTMSSMLKIPTIILYAKEKNNFRDRMFINPYIKERIVFPFQYSTLSNKEMDEIIIFIQKTLSKILS